jgi:hypothetical protein
MQGHAWQCAERQARQAWLGEAGRGAARPGLARRGKARRGKAWQSRHGFFTEEQWETGGG